MADEFHVVFALYPGVTQLDFTGPFEVFARLPNARCTLASVAGGELPVDGGMTFAHLLPLREINACTLLCVPGGYGTVAALEDAEYLGHVQRLGSGARYVTSVCTGSLLLAAAGLLKGKRAASHWAWRDLLQHFDVTPDAGRVVRDGSVITGRRRHRRHRHGTRSDGGDRGCRLRAECATGPRVCSRAPV